MPRPESGSGSPSKRAAPSAYAHWHWVAGAVELPKAERGQALANHKLAREGRPLPLAGWHRSTGVPTFEKAGKVLAIYGAAVDGRRSKITSQCR